ncbi:hypothetical protein PM082_004582 [Marasmius tenuissimus]|nr:hypothetical protein PM082_004582 [Marasmius tenuissimus]
MTGGCLEIADRVFPSIAYLVIKLTTTPPRGIGVNDKKIASPTTAPRRSTRLTSQARSYGLLTPRALDLPFHPRRPPTLSRCSDRDQEALPVLWNLVPSTEWIWAIHREDSTYPSLQIFPLGGTPNSNGTLIVQGFGFDAAPYQHNSLRV